MQVFPRLREIALVAVLSFPILAAGCLEAETVTLPPLRVGDLIEQTGPPPAWTPFLLVKGVGEVHYRDESSPRRVLTLWALRNETDLRPYLIYNIDLGSGLLVEATHLCAHSMDGDCQDDMFESRFFREARAPWGYGTGLFQGMTLREGDQFERSFSNGREEFSVEYSVDRVFAEGNAIKAFVTGKSVKSSGVVNPFQGASGQFLLRSDSPFVEAYKETVANEPHKFRLKSAGLSPISLPASGSVAFALPAPVGTLVDGGTNAIVGLAQELPTTNASFAEFLGYAGRVELLPAGSRLQSIAVREQMGYESNNPLQDESYNYTTRASLSAWIEDGPREFELQKIVHKPRVGEEQTDFVWSEHDPFYKNPPGPVPGVLLDYSQALSFARTAFPYAHQYYAIRFGVGSAGLAEPAVSYEFSWLHQMGKAAGEGEAGMVRTVEISALSGLVQTVFGPTLDELADSGPWANDS